MRRVCVTVRGFVAGLLMLPILAAGCGEVARTGRSPVFLIVESVQAASGAQPGEFGTTLRSDVVTIVERQVGGQAVRVPTTFNDIGRATFRLGLKNPGTAANPNAPSTLNEVTLNRYRVMFRRTDGRSTQGVDVPYGFDAAFTATIPANGSAQVGFELVRHTAKAEPPLANLAFGTSAALINTIAEITFWGRDQAGNEVSAVASISVNFGDFGDPD